MTMTIQISAEAVRERLKRMRARSFKARLGTLKSP